LSHQHRYCTKAQKRKSAKSSLESIKLYKCACVLGLVILLQLFKMVINSTTLMSPINIIAMIQSRLRYGNSKYCNELCWNFFKRRLRTKLKFPTILLRNNNKIIFAFWSNHVIRDCFIFPIIPFLTEMIPWGLSQ
jgi:hypothetical protein